MQNGKQIGDRQLGRKMCARVCVWCGFVCVRMGWVWGWGWGGGREALVMVKVMKNVEETDLEINSCVVM